MKKILSCLLLICLMFGLVGCNSSQEENTEKQRKSKEKETSYSEKAETDDDSYLENKDDNMQSDTHIHSFTPANCLTPETCATCGLTRGVTADHNYVNGTCTYCNIIDPDSLPKELKDVYLIDSYNYEYKTGTFVDSYGNSYNGAYQFYNLFEIYNNNEPRGIYNLNGEYSNFSGSIVASSETNPKYPYAIYIYVDNELKFSKTDITKVSEKTDFSINVENGKVLKIVAHLVDGLGDTAQTIAIVDAKLAK